MVFVEFAIVIRVCFLNYIISYHINYMIFSISNPLLFMNLLIMEWLRGGINVAYEPCVT